MECSLNVYDWALSYTAMSLTAMNATLERQEIIEKLGEKHQKAYEMKERTMDDYYTDHILINKLKSKVDDFVLAFKVVNLSAIAERLSRVGLESMEVNLPGYYEFEIPDGIFIDDMFDTLTEQMKSKSDVDRKSVV